MYELNHKEGRVLKNWWFWIVLDKTLESPLDNKENRPVSPKVNQLWIFIERTDAEVEAPILWPPDEEVDLLEKTLMLGKIEGKRRREQQKMRCLHSITDSMDMNWSRLREIMGDKGAWHATVHGVAKSQTRPRNWMKTILDNYFALTKCLVLG